MFFYLFVYGTLKRGHGNSHYLDDGKFLGVAFTSKKFSLIIEGLPFMIENKNNDGNGVKGELYIIDKMTLDKIDRLEGHPTFYTRELIEIEIDGEIREAHAYIYRGGLYDQEN